MSIATSETSVSRDAVSVETAEITFEDLPLSEPILRALRELGYVRPTPIQVGCIEPLLRDRDLIGQAQTGTGKTAAFMLPILERIDPTVTDVQALVLCPTRELALQVADAARQYGVHVPGANVVPVYGGASLKEQIDRVRRGATIVVGTPGRVLDLLRRGKLVLSDTRMVVLDEADEMLSMGFIDDVRAILRRAPWGKQTALFSATMPAEIKRLAEEELHSPEHVRIAPKLVTVESTDQYVIFAEPNEKRAVLERILDLEDPHCAIIFTRTKLACQRLADELDRHGRRVRALHGDMGQGSRDSVMIAFRDVRVPLLVATDVAARGLDVSHVSHVINYEMPDDAEVYVHRIGRTGRVGRDGIAISIVSKRERQKYDAVVRLTGVTPRVWGGGGAVVSHDEPAKAAPEAAPPTASRDGAEARPRRRRRRGGGGGTASGSPPA